MMKLEVIEALKREKEVLESVHKQFAQGLHDCEAIVLPAAQALARPHRRTGRYMRSLGYVVDDAKLEAALYSGGKIAPHAHLVEFGSSKMPPQGIMRKAAEQTREQMGQAIARRCKEPL